jgi:hypothetical protein
MVQKYFEFRAHFITQLFEDTVVQSTISHIVHTTTVFNTSASFGGKFFVANACLCRTQCVTMMCGALAFTSELNADFGPSMTGAPSEQTAETISHENRFI